MWRGYTLPPPPPTAAWYAASTLPAWVVRRAETTLRALTTLARGLSGAGAVEEGAVFSVSAAKVVVFFTRPPPPPSRPERSN